MVSTAKYRNEFPLL